MPISLRYAQAVLPYFRYSPENNTVTVAGKNGNTPHEIPFLNRSFAFDPESGSMGWLDIGERLRDWKPFPIGAVVPERPGPNYKRGFALLVYAPKLLGSPECHEMCASTRAHMSFCERLYNMAEPEFGKGLIPIVRFTAATPIKVGKGKSRELEFEIVNWVPRPAAMIEAIAKLKAAGTAPKDAAAAAGSDDDDFEDEEPVTEKPNDAPVTKKPRGRPKKAQPEAKSSDILDDDDPL